MDTIYRLANNFIADMTQLTILSNLIRIENQFQFLYYVSIIYIRPKFFHLVSYQIGLTMSPIMNEQ